jgi:hypothetical protein
MSTRGTFVAALSVVCVLLGQQVYSQRGMGMQGRGSAGWGPGTPYARMYDPKTVETVSGAVASVETLTPMQGMGAGLHLLLNTDKGVISVHLGPAWYLESQDVSLQPGDRVQVLRRYVILGACNPELAHRALETELAAGLLLPCNVCLWEEDGGTVVSIAKPASMFEIVKSAALQPLVGEVDQRLRSAIERIGSAARERERT